MMKTGTVVALLMAVTAIASADANPPCLSGIVRMAAEGAKVRACGTTECLLLDGSHKPELVKAESTPVPAPSPRPVRDDHGKHVACAGTTCSPAGPKLFAAAMDAGPKAELEIAPDAGVVVVNGTPWDVEHDREIPVPVPPKAPTTTPSVHPVGKILVATWRNCADDFNCTGPIATIVNRTGVQLGHAFPDGKIVAIDAHHAAIVGDGRKLTTFDTDTGAQLGTIKMIPDAAITGFSIDRLDDTSVGVTWKPTNSRFSTVAVVKAPGNKAPSVDWTRGIAECAP